MIQSASPQKNNLEKVKNRIVQQEQIVYRATKTNEPVFKLQRIVQCFKDSSIVKPTIKRNRLIVKTGIERVIK